MEIVNGVLVILGLIVSWHIGWNSYDWTKWLFGLRFRAADTHSVIEPPANKSDPYATSWGKLRKENFAFENYVKVQQEILAAQSRNNRRYGYQYLDLDIDELFSCCPDCDGNGDKQYSDNIEYLNQNFDNPVLPPAQFYSKGDQKPLKRIRIDERGRILYDG